MTYIDSLREAQEISETFAVIMFVNAIIIPIGIILYCVFGSSG